MPKKLKAIWRYIRKRILLFAGGLAVLTGIVTNFDSLADMWGEYRPDPGAIATFKDAVNQPIPAQMGDSPVLLELVQTPREQSSQALVFDLYLRNTGSDDILISSLVYADGYIHTAAGVDPYASHQFIPNGSYTIPVRSSAGDTVALSPPYLLKGKSRGAIRVQFDPDLRGQYKSSLAFKLLDSRGREVAAVNAMKGD